MSSTNNLSLQNLENYNKQLSETPIEVFCKYNEIINEFIIQFSNISSYTQKEPYIKYIIKCGINTITHIFNVITLYTMNMELTKLYCNQGAYYYSEFTEQMVGEHTSFLKLSTKDAIMFVYKKSIFEINDEYKNNFSISDSTNNKFSIINLLIKIYTDMLFNSIDKSKLIKTDVRIFYKEISINCMNIYNIIILLFTLGNSEKKNSIIQDYLKVFSKLIEKLNINLSLHENMILQICEQFVKKIAKIENIDINKIEKKFHQDKFNEMVLSAVDTYSINKFINWLLQ